MLILMRGYETTTNAILYGLIILALRPDIQNNVREEIDSIYAEAAMAGRNVLTYDDDFEKLEYTYGFMVCSPLIDHVLIHPFSCVCPCQMLTMGQYETFRLFPGVILITKMVKTPQNIFVSDSNNNTKPYLLPAGTRVYLSSPAVQYHPKYWPEPYKLDPGRWKMPKLGSEDKMIVPDTSNKRIHATDKTRHMRGTLLTFSDGARACLGRKFAQAEYMAFFAGLLRDYRVELAPGSDAKTVERDLFLKCAGKVTLAPLNNIKLSLRRRVDL
jgi:cytochrome P450